MSETVSHAGRFLDGIQERRRLSDFAMANSLNISPFVLKRLKYQQGAGIADATLRTIVENISESPREQATFLACYLRDRICGPPETVQMVRILVDEDARIEESHHSETMMLASAAARVAQRDPTARAVLAAIAGREALKTTKDAKPSRSS